MELGENNINSVVRMVKALTEKRGQAVRLRKQGKSYSQIKKELEVSKSTLSYWLRRYPLSRKQLDKLVYKSEKRIERYRNTMRKKRENRLNFIYSQERKRLTPLNDKENYIAGLFLYWGEGGKTKPWSISLSNTDPRMISFFIEWAEEYLDFSREMMVVRLHLYKDMNIEKELDYWSRRLRLAKKQFRKPYIKKTTLRGLTYKTLGHGTCNIIINNRDVAERVLMGMKVIADQYK